MHGVWHGMPVGNALLIRSAVYILQGSACSSICYASGLWHGVPMGDVGQHTLTCCGCRALTKTRLLIGARSSLAPAPAIHCLPGVGGSGVPSQRVWCAPSRRGGSGVPSPGRSGVPSPGESLACLPWRG